MVGDIIEISTGESVPADCLLLTTMYSFYKLVQGRDPFLLKLTNWMVRPIGNYVKVHSQANKCN